MSSIIKANQLCSIRDVLQGREMVATCLGPDLRPIFLSLAGRADYRRLDRSGVSFPKLFAGRSNRFCIHYFSGGAWSSIDLPATHENYHCIQPLPVGNWLALRGRAADVTDENAHIFDRNGRLICSFHAGDGIEDCQVTSNGKIWVSFFDEGVYSDIPTGRSGLLAFNDQGMPIADFHKTGEEVGDISDCYALNVCSDNDAWLCYYTDFPIVHLRNGALEKCWKGNPISGSHAFAIADDSILFAGSYDHTDVLLNVRLSDMAVKELQVTDEYRVRIQGYRAIGRGHKLILVTDTDIYEVDARCSKPGNQVL